MIPTTASPARMRAYVARILAAWEAAGPAGQAAGRAWYPRAFDLAAEIGHGDARLGAGLLAALSANCGWARNVDLARDAARGNVHGHTGPTLAKVRAILAGADPAEILPAGLKTGHFYRCILNPADPGAVTIDRHAHDIATGQRLGAANRGLSNVNRYATLAGAYLTAGARAGELASAMQAGTWEAWRA